MPINSTPNIAPLNTQPLNWGTIPKDWHPEVKKLYKSFMDSPFLPYFYQTDISMMRILAEHHSSELHGEKPNANLIKTLFTEWGAFGATVRDRANINLVIQQAEKESEFKDFADIIEQAKKVITQDVKHD
jgi:hypothetical protein